MKHVHDYRKRYCYWEFDEGIHLFYEKKEELSDPKMGIGEYEEIAGMRQHSKFKEETVFTLKLTRIGQVEKAKLTLHGDEDKFKQFINCTLDGVTLEEYRKLPSEVKILLDRKDYELMPAKK